MSDLLYILEALALLALVYAYIKHRSRGLLIHGVFFVSYLVLEHPSKWMYAFFQVSDFRILNGLVLWSSLHILILLGVLIRQSHWKRRALFFTVLYLIVWVWLSRTYEPITANFQALSYSFGALATIILIIYYIYEQLLVVSSTTSIWNRFFFVILSAYFIRLAVELPLLNLMKYYGTTQDRDISDLSWAMSVRDFTGVLYYLLHLTAFSWAKKFD